MKIQRPSLLFLIPVVIMSFWSVAQAHERITYHKTTSTTATSQTSAVTLASSDMAGYWKFDEGAGTSALDSSGNNNAGTLVNGPVWTGGKKGNALSFDGLDDYVNAGSGATLDNLSAMTIAAWINPASMGENGRGRIVAKSSGSNLPSIGWSFYVTSEVPNGIKFAVDHTSAHLEHASAANAITLNQWQHVAVTWDGSRSYANAHIYVNGKEVAYAISDNAVGTRASDAAQNLFIGNNPALTRSFKGVIDDVQIYNRVLTPEEIAALAGGTTPPPSDTTPPTVALTAPANGASVTVGSAVTIAANASDNVGVTAVDFKVDGSIVGSDSVSPYAVSWSGFTSGAHTIVAVARDAAGNVTTSTPVSVTAVSSADTTPPVLSGGSPTGTLPAGTTATTLSVSTNENATCRYSATAGTAYAAMTGMFTSTGGTSHSTTLSGLTNGTTYNRYIRCQDASGNANTSDFVVTFSVASEGGGGIWKPALNTSWQMQFTGLPVDQSVNATMYDIDLFDNDTSVIASLHSKGRKVVCYFSAGSWEDWRPDASQFPASVLGNSNGWPGERWLDIRNLTALGPIMNARLDLAKQKGCDGVDPDNMDGYTNNTGFPLTGAQQITYNKFIADAAHARGLSVGLKNDIDQVDALLNSFDWMLNEQCFQYNECNTLTPFISAGKPVFNVEYSLQTSQFCPQANAMNFNSLKKNLNLDASRTACR